MAMTTIKIHSKAQAKKLKGKTDWKRLEKMTDADVSKAALSDPDAPLLTSYQLIRFRPFKFLKNKLRL